jgi:hypothetical protein
MSFYGVPKGIMYGQQERVDELNERINERQFSDRPLAPNFAPRPITTKYTHFPIIDRRGLEKQPILEKEVHSIGSNFNPGTHRAPPDGFLQNVDTESILRNQHVAVQKGANQSVYVPMSNSDLYKVTVPSKVDPMPNPLLFSSMRINPSVSEVQVRGMNLGNEVFNNHTRNQLRSL